MISMTGFGKAEFRGKTGAWLIECASINRKQIEVVIQMPRNLSSLEPQIRQEVASRIGRGRVAVSINYQAHSSETLPRIHPAAAATAYQDLKQLKDLLGLTEVIGLEHILRHPAVFSTVSHELSTDTAWEEIRTPLTVAINEMIAMRKREGATLANDILLFHHELSLLLSHLQALAPQVPIRYHALLMERLERANLHRLPDETRIASEVALFADRCDITEELARLQSHLAQFLETLNSVAPVGRTLEFIVQEMFREINTTGAKANDAEISRHVVNAKSQLDKIREQLSNVE